MNILITGGSGDLAQYLNAVFTGNGHVVYMPKKTELDVTDLEGISDFLKDKTIDILINAAGSLHSGRFLDTDPNLWRNDINVNLIGTYNCTWVVLNSNPNAKVINISSTAGFNAYKDWSSYCCSKAAVITLSRSLFNDGYDVYCVCPGAIETKFRKNMSIVNNNVMDIAEASSYIESIVDGKYQAGDVLFFRKGVFVLNPDKGIH